jgi:outer membrane protein TolC
MKTKTLIAFAVLACVQAAVNAEINNPNPAAGKESSLSEVLRAVTNDNPALKAARARWQAARERVPQAAAWEDPKLDANQVVKRYPKAMPESMTDTTVSLEQTVPVSGKNLSRARGARAEAQGVYEEYRRMELDTVLRAKKAYYRLEAAVAELEINKQNDGLLQQFSEISRAKYEVGGRAQADVLMAETELSKNSEACVELERQFSDAQSELNMLMNRPPEQPVGRPRSEKPVMRELVFANLSAVVLANRPELQLAKTRVELQKARVQYAKREWIPDPSFRVGVSRYNDATNAVSEVSAGVSIGLPWVNAKKYNAGIREAQASLEEAQQTLESENTAALAALRDQLKKIETFHHHYMLYHDKILPLAWQVVKSEQSAYESDKTTFLELTNAQHSLNEFQHEELEHLRDYKIALAELDALIGSPMPAAPSKTIK